MAGRNRGLRAEAPALGPGPRLAWLAAAWGALFAASPGILTRDGSFWLAIAALVAWALTASRPGPKAFWIEWLAAAAGLSAAFSWTTMVLWFTLVGVSIVPAVYMAFAGIVLRRLARGFPLALAVPVAWVGLETLRASFDPPFGFGWLRLGHHAHATAWIAGGLRVAGVGGLSFAMAACAGALADALRAWRTAASGAPPAADPRAADRARTRALPRALPSAGAALATAGAALAVPALMGLVTRPVATEPGPIVLLVQPAVPQVRKMQRPDPRQEFEDLFDLTRAGLEEARRAGETPDLVAWGETMFPWSLADRGVLAAWDRGSRSLPWARDQLTRENLVNMERNEAAAIGGVLFGRDAPARSSARLLPAGTSFLSGILLYGVEGVGTGAPAPAHAEDAAQRVPPLRRRNAIVLWDGRGERSGSGGKIHLVPGAEQLYGLERFAWVVDLSLALAGYVPDLEGYAGPAILELGSARESAGGSTPGGGAPSAPARWRFGASVCFDNAFEDPYTRAVDEAGVDFHLVTSNEGWYGESFEYDQMMAFSRCMAIATSRSFVRATNSGISAVLDPSGTEVARLERGGRDRMVRGTLRARIPVPVPSERASTTFFARTDRAWNLLWVALAALLPWIVRRRAVTA